MEVVRFSRQGALLQMNQHNSGKPALQPGEIAPALSVSPERWQQAQLALKASEVNNLNGQLQYSSGFDRVNEDPQLDWLRSALQQIERCQQVLLKRHLIDGVAQKHWLKPWRSHPAESKELCRTQFRSCVGLLNNRQRYPSRDEWHQANHQKGSKACLQSINQFVAYPRDAGLSQCTEHTFGQCGHKTNQSNYTEQGQRRDNC